MWHILDLPPTQLTFTNEGLVRDSQNSHKTVSCHPGADEPASWLGGRSKTYEQWSKWLFAVYMIVLPSYIRDYNEPLLGSLLTNQYFMVHVTSGFWSLFISTSLGGLDGKSSQTHIDTFGPVTRAFENIEIRVLKPTQNAKTVRWSVSKDILFVTFSLKYGGEWVSKDIWCILSFLTV